MTDLQQQQSIRLFNTLLAAAGGLLLTFVLGFAWYQDYLRVSTPWVILWLSFFWAGNSTFIYLVKSGKNLRFADPSLSFAQMVWANSVTISVMLMTVHIDAVVYMLLFVTLVYGIFRLDIKEFRRVTAYALTGVCAAILVRHIHIDEHSNHFDELVNLTIFAFCLVTLTKHCESIVALRNRLRQQNIQLKNAVETKQNFLANTSHEIRTPINGVLGMIEIALAGPISADTRHHLSIAQASGKALLTVINDILDFSKIDAGKLIITPIVFELDTFIYEVISIFSAQTENKRLEFILHMSPEQPRHIKADSSRLRQILNNLIGNAIKFTHQGEVVVQVETQQHQHQWVLNISVKDTGIGIATDKLDDIFASFTQADTSTTRLFGGTGLGLAISKQLCLLMDGDIQVISELGKGSEFKFFIPIELAENQDPINIPDHDDVLKHKRILVVDDNATNRLVLRNYLQQKTIDVIEAESAEQAEALLQSPQFKVDLALFDVQMPITDGLMLTKTIRQLEHRASLPIILLSSAIKANVGSNLDPLNIHAYLNKPILPNALFLEISNALSTPYIQVKHTRSTTDISNKSPLTDTHLAQESTLKTVTLLAVDDNLTNCEIIKTALSHLGYTVDMAYNGLEALNMIKAALLADKAYPLVFMDCQMPVMDGYEATRQLRQWEDQQTQPHTCIVAMTAHAMAGDREKCLLSGMDDYMSKPLQSEILRGILLKYIPPELQPKMANTVDTLLPNPAATKPTLEASSEPRDLVWDSQALMALLNHKKERMQQLLRPFLHNLSESRTDIIHQIQAQEWSEAYKLIHTLKGASLNMGARELPSYLRTLEQKIQTQTAIDESIEIPTLTQHCQTLKQEIETYLNNG